MGMRLDCACRPLRDTLYLWRMLIVLRTSSRNDGALDAREPVD